MLRYLIPAILVLFTNSLFATGLESRLALRGDFIQGGLVIVRSSIEVKTAKLGTVKLPIHANKTLFVFGFGRDAKSTDTLVVEFKDGERLTKTFEITQRKYKIDRVEGVARKYVSPPESVLSRIRNDGKLVADARAQLSFRLDFTEQAIQPAQGRISGVYGSQRIFNGVPKRPHFGMDIAAPTGTQVVAPLPGKVVLAEPDLYYSGGTLIVDHGLGVTSTYIHLSKLHVKVGDEIQQGQLIAEIGATGRVTGPHLDWRLNWFKRRLDPQLLL